MITLKLTKKEAKLLMVHWAKNLSYGWDSSFGGHEETDKRAVKRFNADIKIAQGILIKLNNKVD